MNTQQAREYFERCIRQARNNFSHHRQAGGWLSGRVSESALRLSTEPDCDDSGQRGSSTAEG